MSPQRRTALVSVGAAVALIGLKLGVGISAHSLALLSEAAHSGTDLVAALLTFFAVGVAGRPADTGHHFGHGKAEHLAALAEAAILALVSLAIAWQAVRRLAGHAHAHVDARWYVLVVVGIVIAVDISRATVSLRAARRYHSAALASNALHFAGDLAGSTAVFAGLLLVRAGHPRADAAAAVFVAVLVLAAAGGLMRRNVDVLMDRVPAEAEEAARRAIAAIRPRIDLRRLRMRQAAGRQFADVVIGVSPGDAVAQGHAAADQVESAVRRVLPGSDVVVHVEPGDESDLRDRAHAAALAVPRVREVHNVVVVSVDGRTEVSLHLKLPGELSLEEAHEIGTAVERAIVAAVAPEVDAVRTHLEPLAEPAEGSNPDAEDVAGDAALVTRIVEEATGRSPRELRFLHTTEGLVAFLTLGLDPSVPLAEAHARASEIEERIRRVRPQIADVIVHTEP